MDLTGLNWLPWPRLRCTDELLRVSDRVFSGSQAGFGFAYRREQAFLEEIDGELTRRQIDRFGDLITEVAQ